MKAFSFQTMKNWASRVKGLVVSEPTHTLADIQNPIRLAMEAFKGDMEYRKKRKLEYDSDSDSDSDSDFNPRAMRKRALLMSDISSMEGKDPKREVPLDHLYRQFDFYLDGKLESVAKKTPTYPVFLSPWTWDLRVHSANPILTPSEEAEDLQTLSSFDSANREDTPKKVLELEAAWVNERVEQTPKVRRWMTDLPREHTEFEEMELGDVEKMEIDQEQMIQDAVEAQILREQDERKLWQEMGMPMEKGEFVGNEQSTPWSSQVLSETHGLWTPLPPNADQIVYLFW